VRASFVSFAVGAIVLLVVVLIAARGGGHRAGAAPWWAWVGGAIGASYVVSSIVVAPRLGSAAFFGLVVASQLMASVLIDRFGWLGFAQRQVGPMRLAGVVLLVAGALFVRLF
jgi:transporter family-2 protein